MPATTQRPTQPCVITDAHETVQGGLIRLTGWFDQINNSVRALLFGEMVTRSQPVKHYPSDLYHDARWIATNVNGPMTFYWAPRTGGTGIGTDRTLVGTRDVGKVLYRIDLFCERGLWSVTFTSEPLSDRP
jgi:hypothetical protein